MDGWGRGVKLWNSSTEVVFPYCTMRISHQKEDLERNMTVILRMTSVVRRRIFSFNNQYKLCVSVLTQKSLLRFGNAMLRIVVRLSVLMVGYRTPSVGRSQ